MLDEPETSGACSRIRSPAEKIARSDVMAYVPCARLKSSGMDTVRYKDTG